MATHIKPPFGAAIHRGHPLARRLVGAWLLHEGRGGAVNDLSGNGRTGTLTDMDPASDWMPGAHGHALDFDGSDDRVIVAPDAGINLGTANACVMRFRAHTIGIDVFVGHKAYNDGGYALCAFSGDIHYSANGSYVGVPHGIAAGDEVWLGVSRQGTSVTFYKNGRPLGTPQTLAANNPLTISAIGCYRAASAIYAADMRCDYVYCWNRPLSAAEMAWLHREPFCFVTRPVAVPLLGFPVGQIHNLSGSISAFSSASGTAAAAHLTQRPCDVAWSRDALFNGMTGTSLKLGTALTRGWFWMRPSGCTVVHGGPSAAEVDFSVVVCVADADARQIALPAYLSHEPGSTCCYVVRRFNGCGQQERTTGAAVVVRISPDGQLAEPAPNGIVGLAAEPIEGGRLRLTWTYCPLDQAAAPQVFNVHWDHGTGVIDFGNVLAVLPYEGRRSYGCDTEPLDDGRYLFAVQPESAAQVESLSHSTVAREIKGPPTDSIDIVSAEAI